MAEIGKLKKKKNLTDIRVTKKHESMPFQLDLAMTVSKQLFFPSLGKSRYNTTLFASLSMTII